MKVYTEDMWFDNFYPKEWGDWKEYYNIAKYRETMEVTGCSWMNYKLTGYCLSENKDGLMEVRKYNYSRPYTLDHFFVETCCDEIQPFFQPKSKSQWAGIFISKLTSNLDIYQIYVYGCDDASYTKHFSSEEDLNHEIKVIKDFGINHIFYQNSDYFFTN